MMPVRYFFRCWPLVVLLVGPIGAASSDHRDSTLPAGAVVRLGSTRLRPSGPAQGIAFSPDGKMLATTTGSNLQLWDIATGLEKRRITVGPAAAAPGRPMGGLSAVRFTPDGKTLVVATFAGGLRLLDVATGKEIRELATEWGGVRDLSLSADGTLLAAAAGNGSVFVWELPEGRLRHKHPGTAGQAVLTPDGKFLITLGRDGVVRVIDAVTAREVRRLGEAAEGGALPPGMVRRGAGVPPNRPRFVGSQALAVSPDSRLVALGGWSGPVSVCSLASGKTVAHVAVQAGTPQGLAFSPNGRFLAVAQYPGARLYGLASGAELRQLEPARPTVCRTVVFSPDGQRLAGLQSDGTVHLWDLTANVELYPCEGHSGHVQTLAFLADGRLVSCDASGGLLAWDLSTGRSIAHARNPLRYTPLGVTADGKGIQFYGHGTQLQVWRPDSPNQMHPVDIPAPFDHPMQFYPHGASVNGRWLAILQMPQRKVRIYELGEKVVERRVLSLPAGLVVVNGLICAPDGSRLLALCGDGTMRVLECATGRHMSIQRAAANFLAWGRRPGFAPDGRSLLIHDSDVWIAEVVSGQQRCHLVSASAQPVATAWSADGRLVACGLANGQVRVFDAASGQEIVMRQPDQQMHDGNADPVLAPVLMCDERLGTVESLAFSPDVRLLASGGSTGLITVWKVPSLPPQKPWTAERRSSLWAALADPDAGPAGHAIADLVAMPSPAVELLQQRFRPGESHVDPGRLQKLIADLDADEFVVREQAQRELAAAGPDAVEPMRQALAKDPSAEMRRRLRKLLEPYERAETQPARLRAVRAIEVLERIGTPQARGVLQGLAGKMADAEIEQEIKDSLRRIDARK